MFMLGILGTGHCIGMCCPLVFAFPSRSGKVLPHFFHLGRTVVYVAIGVIGAGLSGMAAATGNDPIVWIGHVKVGLRFLADSPGLLVAGTGASKIFRRFQRPSDILTGFLLIYVAAKLAYKAGRAILG
jgi:hypothetical protein